MAAVMLPAYMTQAAIAAARYGPQIVKYGKRALSAGAFAAGMAEQFRGRQRARTNGQRSPPVTSPRARSSSVPYTSASSRSRSRGSYRGSRGNGSGGGRGRTSYRGKGARKRSNSKRSKNKKVMNFLGRGAVNTDETIGQVSDPDMMYLYVHDTSPQRTYATVAEALVRKLCEKAFSKTYMSSYENIISGQDVALGAIKYQIYIQKVNTTTGANSQINVSIDQNSTIDNVGAQLYSVFEDVGMGDGDAKANNTQEFTTITFMKNVYSLAGLVVVDQIILAQLNLKEEIVHLLVSTTVKIQNRSVGANNSTDTTDVNMTPLEVVNMRFTNVPRHKYIHNGPIPGTGISTTGGQLFSQLRSDTGHYSIRGASLTAFGDNGNNWKKCVSKSNFNNCKGSTKSILAPGALSFLKQSYKKSMTFNSYLKKIMKRDDVTDLVDYVSDTVGGGNLICMQDMININTTYDMTLTFQIDRETKAVLTSKNQRSWTKKFATTTVNNP